MKFSIQREVLLKPLQQVVGVVERRQTLPVLANLLVSADGQGVSFTATDLEVELVARANVAVDREGEVTIPARKFVDICRALPDGVQINVDLSGDKVTIKADRSRFTLSTLPASEFPLIEDMEASDKVTVSQAGMKDVIDRTSFAMAHQDVRYYLNGLLLELKEGRMRSVATDGHRLAICDLESELASEGERQIIVPRKGVLELVRMLESEDSEVELELSGSHVRLRKDGGMFTSKLIDGRFPDYEAVIPSGANRILSTDRGLLREALQRASILSNEKYRGVKLEVQPGAMRIVAHNPEQEEAVEEMEVDYDNEGMAIGFNVGYLLDALNALESEGVELAFRDANSSCLLREPGEERCRHVVMPLRL